MHAPGSAGRARTRRVHIIREMAIVRTADDENSDRDHEDLTIAPIVGPDDTRRFTDSGIEIKPLYTDSDLPADLHERLGEPGEYPFARGIHGDMYRRQLWTMRQYAGYASAKESNER